MRSRHCAKSLSSAGMTTKNAFANFRAASLVEERHIGDEWQLKCRRNRWRGDVHHSDAVRREAVIPVVQREACVENWWHWQQAGWNQYWFWWYI